MTTAAPAEGRTRSVRGRLRLRFEAEAGGRTTLRLAEQAPPLRVVRAFPQEDGAALVHLHNISGGILGGDDLETVVEVGPGARAQVTSTSATRLYRCRPGAPPARQVYRIRVEEDGLLECVPDPLIPFAGARYLQETTIELAPGAGVFWWETVAPGREARGEVFAYEWLQIGLVIRTSEGPLLIERARLEPARCPLASPVRLGPYRTFASFAICRAGTPGGDWQALEGALAEIAEEFSRPGETLWGVSALPADGLLVRGLSRAGRAVAPGLVAFWRAAKERLYGRAPVLPRKIY